MNTLDKGSFHSIDSSTDFILYNHSDIDILNIFNKSAIDKETDLAYNFTNSSDKSFPFTSETCLKLVDRGKVAENVFDVFTGLFHFGLPLLIVLVSVGVMVMDLRKRMRGPQSRRESKYERMAKTLSVLLAIFWVCMVHGLFLSLALPRENDPLSVVIIWTVQQFLSRCLLLFNSSINPVVYVFLNPDYRKLILEPIMKQCTRCQTPNIEERNSERDPGLNSIKLH